MNELRISEFCTTGSGGTPPRQQHGRYFEGGSIPWVKSGELRETFIYDTEEHVTEIAINETSLKVIPSGALLLAMYGATVGRMAILGTPAATNQAVCHIIPYPTVADVGFLFHFLRTCISTLLDRRVGGAQPNISQGIIKDTTVYLPPLPEQKRIAAILDAAEAVVKKRGQAIAKLDSLVQSVFLDMFGDPITNPKGWGVMPLPEVGSFVSGGTPSKSRKEFWNGSLPWVSPKDMKSAYINDSEDHISESVFKYTSLKLLHPGHVLIVVRGMILAHTFPVAVNRVAVSINQDMKGILPREGVNPDYLLSTLRHMSRLILSKVSSAGHGTKRLDTNAMASMLVPIPPMSLQKEFTKILGLLEQQKARSQMHQSKVNDLFVSLQQRAFRGEL
jgi:type I restriction enzyme S subunit